MKIDLNSINPEEFIVTQHEIGGETCHFVRPQPNFFDWREDVLHFRSSIWNSQGELISGSFKKFFNFEEKPAIQPFPNDFSGVNVVEKLDGSTLIVSRYKGQTIMRTRGTVDAQIAMPNGDEIDMFQEKYPDIFNLVNAIPTFPFTFLFEWVSPRNRIVLNYGNEPEIYLTGIVSHTDYKLFPQHFVDIYAQQYGLKRPKIFKFPSAQEMVKDIKVLDGYEGVCAYYNHDQCIRKVKATTYLKLHAFKSQLSMKALAELLYHYNVPKSKEDFLTIIEKEYDFECAVAAKPVEAFCLSIPWRRRAVFWSSDRLRSNTSL